MSPRFCAECGQPAGPNARFCEKCGAELGSPQPTPASPRPDSLPEAPQPTRQPPSAPPTDSRGRPTSLPETGGSSSGPVGVGWKPKGGSIGERPTTATEDTTKPPLPFSKTKIVWNVRGLGQRTAQPNMQVYSFRVERFDAQGNRLPAVTVEMKGIGFEGSLNEGDQVRIDRKPRPGKTIRIKELMNLTAGSIFKVQQYSLIVRILSVPMTLIGYLIVAAFVVGFFWVLFLILSDLF